MRIIGIAATAREYDKLPQQLAAGEFLWISCTHQEFGNDLPAIQQALTAIDGRTMLDFHVQDLLSTQQPSHYDFTSYYDVIVFRRLKSSAPPEGEPGLPIWQSIDTNPVGFALFDHVLLTVHPDDPDVRNHFAQRLLTEGAAAVERARRAVPRLPTSPDELMLRLVDFMVDGYLELRRALTHQLDDWQAQLLDPDSRFDDWQSLLSARNALHQLEDLCEDQNAAIKEWQQSIDDDEGTGNAVELLQVRTRDVLEHIERVLTHVQRLEKSLESAIQLHFSATANRTNDIMRVLTVLTAIFMPLNLVTGIFGMNFSVTPLIGAPWGFWAAIGFMVLNTVVLVSYFWRRHYMN